MLLPKKRKRSRRLSMHQNDDEDRPATSPHLVISCIAVTILIIWLMTRPTILNRGVHKENDQQTVLNKANLPEEQIQLIISIDKGDINFVNEDVKDDGSIAT